MQQPLRPHTERWVYRLLYNAKIFELTSRLYPLFSRRAFHVVCRSVASFYAQTQPAIRKVVQDNLCLLNPATTTKDAVRVFDQFAKTIGDYVVVGAMRSNEIDPLIETLSGLEHLEAARRHQKGVILVTGHYGFFELGTVALSKLGYPVSIVTLSEPSESLTQWRDAWRARWGTQTIEVGKDAFSLLAVTQALQQGRCTAMLADRPFGPRFQKVTLPGGDLCFSTTPAELSWVTECAILPVIISRLPSNKYQILTKPAIYARSQTNRDQAIFETTQQVANSLFEEFVNDPSQWFQFVPVT